MKLTKLMRKLIILLLITIMSVGCSKLKEKSSDNTLEDSQASSKQTLQIDEDVYKRQEYNNPDTLGNMNMKGKVLSSIFQTSTLRTCLLYTSRCV